MPGSKLVQMIALYQLTGVSILILLLGVHPAAAQLAEAKVQWLNDWTTRYETLAELKASATNRMLSDQEKLELISWLDRDSDYGSEYLNQTGQGLGEGFGEYHVDLANVI